MVPFEFATTGALVVTNTYVNRSAERLRGICGNIVPCQPSLDSVVQAIELSMSQVGKYAQRQRQALVPVTQSWDEIFSPAFLDAMIEGPGASPREPAAPAAKKTPRAGVAPHPPTRRAYQPDTRQGA